jgi:chromosome segregation ATPase
MLSDYTRNEQILKSNISHLTSEIDAKKSTITSIKSQFSSLGSNLRSELHSTEQSIRQSEIANHHTRQNSLTLSLASNQSQISSQGTSISTLKSQIASKKAFNKSKFSLFSLQSRALKASKDSALNEFKSIELKIKNWSEKYQISQNQIFFG